jgi:hypothetical protein
MDKLLKCERCKQYKPEKEMSQVPKSDTGGVVDIVKKGIMGSPDATVWQIVCNRCIKELNDLREKVS